MAGGAVALRTWMLNLGALNLLGLFVVAGDADSARVTLRQNNFAVLRWLMAAVAHLVLEGVVHEGLHQLGGLGLMRIVTLHAIRFCERLVLVLPLESGVLGIVTVDAECRRCLGQVEIEFLLASLPNLMCDVASGAAHVEGGVTAPVLGNVQALRVTVEAEVLTFFTGIRFEQLILVRRGMGIVTLGAIANRWRMNRALQVGGFLVGVAG
jgi:hypothetical protein